MGWNRKGVSPLIATVVLIGFAVSIGAVIMSWGKTAFEETENIAPIVDTNANLAWYMGSNIENVCYSDNYIAMTLKGSPVINIKSIFVASKGKTDFVYDEPIAFPQDERDVLSVQVPYDSKKYGEISKLILGGIDTAIISAPAKRCGT